MRCVKCVLTPVPGECVRLLMPWELKRAVQYMISILLFSVLSAFVIRLFLIIHSYDFQFKQ